MSKISNFNNYFNQSKIADQLKLHKYFIDIGWNSNTRKSHCLFSTLYPQLRVLEKNFWWDFKKLLAKLWNPRICSSSRKYGPVYGLQVVAWSSTNKSWYIHSFVATQVEDGFCVSGHPILNIQSCIKRILVERNSALHMGSWVKVS